MSTTESPQSQSRQDPREQGPKPDYPQKPIPPPGFEAGMNPQADHGEESYRGLGRLTDRVALITGADSGIGRAVAIAFAREGADVLLSYLPEEARDGDATREWVEKVRRKAIALPGDMWTPLIPSTMPEEQVKKFGANTAFERAAQPVEIAPLFIFLASNEARYVTGEVYGATGGRTPY